MEIDIKKNVILLSIDSRRADLYSTYDGLFDTPNVTKLAENGYIFKNMYSSSASTVMALSSLINGRWCHEFDRKTYPELLPHEFKDTIFSDFKKDGKKNYILFTDSYFDQGYADGIYRGNDAERIRIEEGFDNAVNKIIQIYKKTKSPVCIFHHASLGQIRGGRAVVEEDKVIGKLLNNIDLSDTTIVFYSDHGFLMGEHYNLFHHAFYPYEEVLKIPFIITCDKPSTINNYISISQVREILNNEFKEKHYLFADTQYRSQRYRITSVLDVKNKWKYCSHYSHRTALTGRQEELYNLNYDPREHRNLLNDRSQHPIRADWNTQNAKDKFSIDEYKENELENKANELRSKISKIWTVGFKQQIECLNSEEGNKISELFDKYLSSSEVNDLGILFIISNYYDQHDNSESVLNLSEIGNPKKPKNFLNLNQ